MPLSHLRCAASSFGSTIIKIIGLCICQYQGKIISRVYGGGGSWRARASVDFFFTRPPQQHPSHPPYATQRLSPENNKKTHYVSLSLLQPRRKAAGVGRRRPGLHVDAVGLEAGEDRSSVEGVFAGYLPHNVLHRTDRTADHFWRRSHQARSVIFSF